MKDSTLDAQESRPLGREIGLAGSVAVSWAAAGGVVVGGFLVAVLTLAGRLSGGGLFLTGTGLFLIGALLGYVHGAVLGFAGRPADVEAGAAKSGLVLGAVYAIPVLAVSWAVALWIAQTITALYVGRILPLAFAAMAWLFGVAILVLAGRFGVAALANAYGRWPERRAGTLLVAASFAALLILLLGERPELWGMPLRVSPVGGVLLAMAASLWIAGPTITVALVLSRGSSPVPGAVRAAGTGDSIKRAGLGLAAGAVLALLAVPFHTPPLAVPVTIADFAFFDALLRALSSAVVTEVLLRFVLVTVLAALLLRWRGPSPRNAILAICGAAIVEVVLHGPAIAGIGFPGGLTMAGYVSAVVFLPALIFGTLYWTRGLGAALVAHAAALLGLGLIVG